MADHTARGHKGARNDLTADYVRSILDYDPETGIFRWKITLSKRATAGKPAGRSRVGKRNKIGIKGGEYMAHRLAWLIMTGEWPAQEVDHRDLDPSNNRWTNLREATPSQNQSNRPVRRHSKTKVTGVCWDSIHQNWIAYINKRHIGHFRSFDNAANARREAEEHLHGEFRY